MFLERPATAAAFASQMGTTQLSMKMSTELTDAKEIRFL